MRRTWSLLQFSGRLLARDIRPQTRRSRNFATRCLVKTEKIIVEMSCAAESNDRDRFFCSSCGSILPPLEEQTAFDVFEEDVRFDVDEDALSER